MLQLILQMLLTEHVMLQEFCDECEGQSRVVRRDAAFADNATLLPEFQRRAGDGIYAGLREGFRVQYLHLNMLTLWVSLDVNDHST